MKHTLTLLTALLLAPLAALNAADAPATKPNISPAIARPSPTPRAAEVDALASRTEKSFAR
jgi:hypothetical protein